MTNPSLLRNIARIVCVALWGCNAHAADVYNCTPYNLVGAKPAVFVVNYTVEYDADGKYVLDGNGNPRRIGLWDSPAVVNKIGPNPADDHQWPAPRAVQGGIATWPRPDDFVSSIDTIYKPVPNAPNESNEQPGWMNYRLKDGDLILLDFDALLPYPLLAGQTSERWAKATEQDAIVGRERRKLIGRYIREKLDANGFANCKVVIYRDAGAIRLRPAKEYKDYKEQARLDNLAWINEGVAAAYDMTCLFGYWNGAEDFDDWVASINNAFAIAPHGKLAISLWPYFGNASKPMDGVTWLKMLKFAERRFDSIIIWDSAKESPPGVLAAYEDWVR